MAKVQAKTNETPDAPIGRTLNQKAPVKTKKEVDTRGLKAGQDHSAIIALEGPANIEVEDIESVVPGPGFATLAEGLAFNEEFVKILIHQSVEEFPEDPIPLGVNGRMCYVFRNQPTMIKRKYVERLCRAKPNTIRQDIGNPDPSVANKLNISAGLKYPFSLIEDKNPKGGLAWLQKLMAEA